MDTKRLSRVEIKDAGRGQVSAVFSTFDVIDSDGDVTLPGAFQDGAEIPISSYGHSSWSSGVPVGKGRIRVTGKEAIVDCQFFMDTQAGKDTFIALKELGPLGQWSYGYDVLESEPGVHDGQDVRILKALQVHEASPVLVGAGVNTRTISAKAADDHGNITTANAADLDTAARRYAASRGWAMPDGSYPIRPADNHGAADLVAAVRAVGRGGGSHNAIRKHVITRARALGMSDQIPDNWNSDGSMREQSMGGSEVVYRAAIRPHKAAVTNRPWEQSAVITGIPGDASVSDLRSLHAWVDPSGDPESKSSYLFPHHHGVGGPANVRSVITAIALLNGANGDPGIPDADRKGVYEHLAAHLRDADREPPELKTSLEGGASQLALHEEAIGVLAGITDYLEFAKRVAALRAQKGKSLSQVNLEALGWVGEELQHLVTEHKSLMRRLDDTPREAAAEELVRFLASQHARRAS